jgi:uncharacterized RDD family membrane protein YckC
MEPLLTPNLETEYPALSDRVQSTFIDLLFIVLLMFISASILDRYENTPDWIRAALFFGIWAVYEPLCTSLGCTIGNLIKGIRVRKVNDVRKRINIFQAFIRYVIKMLLGWLSFITIHSNADRRAIHDLAVGSVMIKKN